MSTADKDTVESQPLRSQNNAQALREKPLSYSFWLGTFLVRGSVAPRVVFDVLIFGIVALAVVCLANFFKAQFDVNLAIPVGPFEAAGAVLGLLLVLRVNAGYNRWWEARVLWGGIVNQSRNLAIAGLAYGPKDGKWQANFIRWVAAFPHVIRRSLRGERDFPELNRLLPNEDLTWLTNSQHMPDAVASAIAEELGNARSHSESPMDGFAFHRAERERSKLIDYLGGCERILKTPLARSSVIQVRQFVFLYLITFPFALLANFDAIDSGFMNFSGANPYLLIPLFVMVLGYFLLSLDRIGMELQNPFDIRRIDFLPLDEMCTTIERNVLELLHETEERSRAVPGIEEVELPPDAKPPTSKNDLSADIS
jgi:putative membrane protein